MNLTHASSSLRFLVESNFDSEVLQSQKTILVAFWAPWSKPCQVIDPVLIEVAEACAGRCEVVKVDADDNPNLSLRLGIQHIPTLLYFEAGQLRDRLVGTASNEAILAKLHSLATSHTQA